MKAAFFKKTGSPDVIEWGDMPDPKASHGEIVIRTIATAPAHVDTYIRAGKFPLPFSLPSPFIIGLDVVGEVIEVGSGVDQFGVGDIVWSNAPIRSGEQGSTAEFFKRDANLFYHLPPGVDPIKAVAVLQAAGTVCRGLIVASGLKRDEILFVNGAAGSVGTALIQLGKARGARVFATTTGAEKMAWCKKQGAEVVFDYKNPAMEEEIKKAAPYGFDVFWDTSQNPNIELGVNLMTQGGRIVLASGAAAKPTFPIGPFYRKNGTLKGFSFTNASDDELKGYALIINRALEDGLLETKIAETLPLKEAKKAHTLLEGKDLWGKIVLVNS